MNYDYLIVGSGLFGSTFARLVKESGKTCLVIDKRNHIAGNCYSEKMEGVEVHMYGPHTFHTNSHDVWNFITRFSNFNNFVNNIKAFSKGKLYSLPFNMNTFYEIWGVKSPEEAEKIIKSQQFKGNPQNLEEQALSMVGKDIYELLIKEYTEKQWGKSPKDLPKSIIKRLPVRYTFDNNYYKDYYQGIPENGYTKLFENLLQGITVKLNTDYFKSRDYFNSISHKIVYTGCIDEFFNYEFGKLDYRSLEFKHESLNVKNFQGNAIINHCDKIYPYTRIVEHKHFYKVNTNTTVITKEYPKEYKIGMIPYYPINNQKNNEIYNKYKQKSKHLTNFVFGGRLSEYRYMDMDSVIKSAMTKFKKEN